LGGGAVNQRFKYTFYIIINGERMNKKKDLDERLYEKHKKAAVYARKLGFDEIHISKGIFGLTARHGYTRVSVESSISPTTKEHRVVINWSSAGRNPDNRRVKRTAEMLLNAIKLKNYLLGKR